MKWRLITVVVVTTACGGRPDTGAEDDHGSGSGSDADSFPGFSLRGTVSNPAQGSQTGRLVVGIIPPAAFGPTVKCDSIVARDDQPTATLPASYRLDGIQLGRYVLVALLIDGQSPSAPGSGYNIKVEGSGVYYNSPTPTESLDLIMMGSFAYECP